MNQLVTLDRLFGHARSRTVLTYIVVGLLLVVAIVTAGRDIAHHISEFETWIAKLGLWGDLALVVLFMVATSLMMPETILSIMAGALFGLVWGLAAVLAGSGAAVCALSTAAAQHDRSGAECQTIAGRSKSGVVLHDMVVFGGLAITVIVVALVARTAHRAVIEAVAGTSAAQTDIKP